MKLTRKQLASALNSLPHPMLVITGKMKPIYEVHVLEMARVIDYNLNPEAEADAVHFKTLLFEFSKAEMDWILINVEI